MTKPSKWIMDFGFWISDFACVSKKPSKNGLWIKCLWRVFWPNGLKNGLKNGLQKMLVKKKGNMDENLQYRHVPVREFITIKSNLQMNTVRNLGKDPLYTKTRASLE